MAGAVILFDAEALGECEHDHEAWAHEGWHNGMNASMASSSSTSRVWYHPPTKCKNCPARVCARARYDFAWNEGASK